jgi:hypothetical protein
MIESPADCEIRSVIPFFECKKCETADIHCQICKVYGENVMSDGMVRKLVRKFNEGCDNVHDEPRSGRPSVVTGDHVVRGGDTETGSPL